MGASAAPLPLGLTQALAIPTKHDYVWPYYIPVPVQYIRK